MGLLGEFRNRNILDSDRIKNIEVRLLNSNVINDSFESDRFFNNFINNAEVEIFNDKKTEDGKSQLQRLAEQGISTTSSTKIGAIISHYSQKDFYTDQSCSILLNMLIWSPEDRKKWKSFDSDVHCFIYQQGNDFESLVPLFFKQNFSDYLIKDWNKERKGLYLKSYNNKTYNVYCRPDYFLYKKGENNDITEGIIIEVKSSSSKTKRLENYKYQIALQNLLIKYFYPSILLKSCLLFNDYMIEYPQDELIELQKDILKYIPMFWEDFRTKNFKKISVDEYIEFCKNQS